MNLTSKIAFKGKSPSLPVLKSVLFTLSEKYIEEKVVKLKKLLIYSNIRTAVLIYQQNISSYLIIYLVNILK